jgi:Na+/alanine symporter
MRTAGSWSESSGGEHRFQDGRFGAGPEFQLRRAPQSLRTMRALVALCLAAAMALMLSPMQERVSRALNEHDDLPGLMVTSVVAVAILIPVVIVLVLLANQASTFYEWALPRLAAWGFTTF